MALLAAARRREHLRSPWLWLGAATFAAFPIAWGLVKHAVFGSWGDTLVGHWALLRPSPGGAVYYGWAALSAAGVPAVALALAGAVSALRRRETSDRGDLLLLSVVLAAAVLAFFGLLYSFQDRRFLIYAAPPAAVLIAEGLSRLRPPAAMAAAAAATVLWSFAPSPGPWSSAAVVTLWPVPPLQLEARELRPTARRVRLGLADAELVARPAASFVRHGNPARVWRARRPPDAGPGPGRPPKAAAGVRGVVFLHRPGAEPQRYRTLTRLGAVLRVPAQFLPRGFLAPCLERWAPADPVEGAGGWDLYRLEPAGVDGAWWLATTSGDPPPRRDEHGDAASPPEGTGALREARRLRRFIEGSDTVVAIVAPPGTGCAPVSHLPFLVGTGEVFVLAVGGEEVPARVRDAPVLGELRTGRSRAVRTRLGGLPAAIVIDLGPGAQTGGGAGGRGSFAAEAAGPDAGD